MDTLFVLSYNFYVRARVTPCSFLCRKLLGYILYGNTFACIRNVGLFCGVRQFDISDKTVIYNYSLRSTFACTLCFKNINIENLKKRNYDSKIFDEYEKIIIEETINLL